MKAEKPILICITALLVAASAHFSIAQTDAASDPRAAVIAAYNALDSRTSFVATMLATNDSIKGTGTVLEMRMASSEVYYSSFGSGAYKFEGITIGNDEYSKEPGGKWTRSQKDPLAQLLTNLQRCLGDIPLAAMTNVQALGETHLAGLKTTLYRYEIDEEIVNRMIAARLGSKNALPKTDLDHTVKVWVGPDGLPVRIEDTRRQSGPRGRIDTLKKVTDIKYDEKVIVEAPKI